MLMSTLLLKDTRDKDKHSANIKIELLIYEYNKRYKINPIKIYRA